MGNPFYIPRKSTGEAIMEGLTGGINTGLNIYKLKQESDIASTRSKLMKEGQDLEKRGLDLKAEEQIRKYGGTLPSGETVQGVEPRKLSIMETQARQEETKIPVHQKEFNLPQYNMLEMQFKEKGLDKTFPSVLKSLKNMAADEKFDSTGSVYLWLKSNWKDYRDMSLNDIAKRLQTEPDPAVKADLQKAWDFLSADNEGAYLDMVMPDVARAIKMENIELGAKVAKAGKESLSTLGKLMNEYNNLDPESPMRKIYEERMAKEAQATGEQISVGPDGSVTITKGPISAMQKKTTGEIEGKIVDINEGISRLNEIAGSYDPKFLQLDTKLGTLKTKWQEIGKGTPIEKGLDILFGSATEQDRKTLEGFSDFKRSAISNINLYIKEITGAQMSEKEADRIRQGMPDPGEGVFDGDSPSQFESKWKSTMKRLRSAQARYIYYRKNGFDDRMIQKMAKTGSLMSINDVQEKMNDRVRELIKNGIDEGAALQQVQKEFFTFE